MHLVHSPICAPVGFIDKFRWIENDNANQDRMHVAAMVNLLDTVVGGVVDALAEAGLWEESLLVWSSDNGAAIEEITGAKNSFPLRGGYTTNWDGGVRAPAFVNGGILPASVRGTQLGGEHSYIHLADFFATFCALAGVSAVDEKAAAHHLPPIDSLDMCGKRPRSLGRSGSGLVLFCSVRDDARSACMHGLQVADALRSEPDLAPD